jgi:D-alanine transaminase
VYEVWRVIDGRAFEADAHLERLAFGLRELRIAPPAVAQPAEFHAMAHRLLGASSLGDGEATIYLEITRGAAPRTHQFPPPGTRPTVYAIANRLEPPEKLRAKGAIAITTPDIRWLRCDIKTVQLLPNVLAKQAAAERGATEAIFVRDGVVTEGSHTNVFGVLDGVVLTHPSNHLILSGVTRKVVLGIARRLDLAVREEAFRESDIARLSELFVVGTTTDVMPLVRVNEQTVGAGVPGPIATRVQGELRARLGSVGAFEQPRAATIAS